MAFGTNENVLFIEVSLILRYPIGSTVLSYSGPFLIQCAKAFSR